MSLFENVPPVSVYVSRTFGAVPSLNDGRGAMPASRNPFAGTNPASLGFIHIVPPVMMMRTVDSWAMIVSNVSISLLNLVFGWCQ